MKSLLFTIIKIGISATIMYFLLRGMDMEALKETVRTANLPAIILVLVLFLVIQAVSTLRWSIILSKDVHVPYMKLLGIFFVGMFFNNFLPTLVGGDVIKGYYLYKASGKGGLAAASVFLDRYTGFTAMIVISFIALIVGFGLLEGTGLIGFFLMLIGGFVAISLIMWVNFLHSWAMSIMSRIHFYGINDKIDAFYHILMGYKGRKDILGKAFLCSLFVQAGVIFGYYVMGRALGVDISIGYYFLFVPLATVSAMLPISLAGLGIREGVFIYLFAMAGVGREEALAISLTMFFAVVVSSLPGGIVYIKLGGKKEVDKEAHYLEDHNA